MPELPEVEEVRRTLEPHLVGVRIKNVTVRRDDFVVQPRGNVCDLAGQRVERTLRHGKKLFCITKGDAATLMIHLGMSGRVDCVKADSQLLGHTHFVMTLASGIDVRVRDPRRFGGVWYYRTLAEAWASEIDGKLGPDALKLQIEDFFHWQTLRGRLKARLLGQTDVAGLGNIYVDESLWRSGLHPLQRVDRIQPAELSRLVEAVRAVLHQAIDSGGTTLRDYRNVSDQPGRFAARLQAYGRGGKPCLRCGGTMKQSVVCGRTTVFCPACQRRH